MADPIAAFEGFSAGLTPLTYANPAFELEVAAPNYTAPIATSPLSTAPLSSSPLGSEPLGYSPLGEFPLADPGPALGLQEDGGLFEPLLADFRNATRAYGS